MILKPQGPFTSGHLAKMFQVAPRTISKWIDDGIIEGYRIPGSKDRRVTREKVLSFLKRNPTLPVPSELCHIPLTFELCGRYLELMPEHWIGDVSLDLINVNNVISVCKRASNDNSSQDYIVRVLNVLLEDEDIPRTLYGFIRLCTLHIDGPETEPRWVVI